MHKFHSLGESSISCLTIYFISLLHLTNQKILELFWLFVRELHQLLIYHFSIGCMEE